MSRRTTARPFDTGSLYKQTVRSHLNLVLASSTMTSTMTMTMTMSLLSIRVPSRKSIGHIYPAPAVSESCRRPSMLNFAFFSMPVHVPKTHTITNPHAFLYLVVIAPEPASKRTKVPHTYLGKKKGPCTTLPYHTLPLHAPAQ